MIHKRGGGESGNAILGFAVAAPIVSFLVIAVINISAAGWHRELLAHEIHTMLIEQSRTAGTASSIRHQVLSIAEEFNLANAEMQLIWKAPATDTRVLHLSLTGELKYSLFQTPVTVRIEDMVMFE